MHSAQPLKAVFTGAQPIPSGTWISGAATLGQDRAAVLLRQDDAPDRLVVMDRRSPEVTPLLEGACDGWVCVFDAETDRLVIEMNRRIFVFDVSSLAPVGELSPAPRRALGELAPGGRVLITGSDAAWTLWDLRTLSVIARDDQRVVRHWWVGPRATDPLILLRSVVQDGRWRTWTERADTRETLREAVVAVSEPCETTAALLPGGDTWVGVVTEGQGSTWGPSGLRWFTAHGPQTLLSLGPVQGAPSVIRLIVLTSEHVYIQGGGDHHLLHLPTATLMPCPQDYHVSPSGMMLSGDGVAFDPRSGGVVELRRPDAQPPSGMAISPDGLTALVSTPDALEWWSLTP